jgi:putative tryptophan/tyrosine transport system substrate-binding protein
MSGAQRELRPEAPAPQGCRRSVSCGSLVDRRNFLAIVAGAAATPPRSRVAAQDAEPVVGLLYAGSLQSNSENMADFWRGVAESGYVRGKNIRAEYREAQYDLSRLPDLARDLVRRKVSIIAVLGTGPAVLAAKAATDTIPIVFSNGGNPIRLGVAASLSRPGGNVTGVTDFGNALSAKRLELIKLLVPTVSRIGIPIMANYRQIAGVVANANEGARALSLETVVSIVDNQQDIGAAFAEFAKKGVDGIYVTPSPLLLAQREQIVALAAQYRLPAIYPFIQFAQAGGLMSYGTSLAERSYQAGRYVGLILGGHKAGDLPIRRIANFELAINMTTAKALGLTVPPDFLALADQVIE